MKLTVRDFHLVLHLPDDDEPVAAFYTSFMALELLALHGPGYTLRYRGQVIWRNGAEEIVLRDDRGQTIFDGIYRAEKIIRDRMKDIDKARADRRLAREARP